MHEELDLYKNEFLSVFDQGHTKSPALDSLKSITQRYGEKSLIGEGALKAVYQCEDHHTERQIAWATVKPDRDESYYDALIYEARLTASLKHPNIIKIHDIGVTESGSPYFTMDLKSNTDLAEYTATSSLQDKLDTFLTICSAISYAHSQQILHLDLKPENIQCDQFREVLICDWGLGKVMSDSVTDISDSAQRIFDSSLQTLYGQIKGTPGYMAPEQINPDGIKDQKTDIYALGAILYFLLTGHPPFTGSTSDILHDTENRVPTLAHERNLSVPKAISKIAHKALSKDKSERYQSVVELSNDIIRFLNLKPTIAERPSFFRTLQLFAIRHFKAIATIAIFTGILLSTVLYSANNYQKAKQAETKANSSLQELESDYDNFLHTLSDITDSKYKLSVRFSNAANEKLYEFLGIYGHSRSASPIESHNQFLHLAEIAYEIDPTETSKHNLLRAKAIQLNFSWINEQKWANQNPKFNRWKKVASNHAHFQFDDQSRPAVSELVLFFESFKELAPHDDELLSMSLYYDICTRANLDTYSPAIVAYLSAINKKQVFLLLGGKKLEIKNIEKLKSNRQYYRGDYLNLIRIPILALEGEYLKLNRIQNTKANTLDLSKVAKVIPNSRVPITGIKKVILSQQMDEKLKYDVAQCFADGTEFSYM